MNIQTTILNQNIVLLYDSLNLQAIENTKLRNLGNVQAQQMVITPEVIIVRYPSIVVQMGNKRTKIAFQESDGGIDAISTWDIAHKCNELASASESTLGAYGFNYGVEVTIEGANTYTAMVMMFAPDMQKVQGILKGTLLSLSFTPRLAFRRDQTLYDLMLQPIDEQRIQVNLNAHFEFEGITLPTQDQLKASFHQEFEYLTTMLPRMFEESQ